MKNNFLQVEECPVKRSLNILGGKWKLRIIGQIGIEIRRYGDLKRQIPDISEKMLIQELKSLVEFNILDKKSYNEIPPKVEYSLTKKGLKVLPILESLSEFGKEN
ncbi:helix-turn-helix transcriptional regulator [Flavobacterium psychrophilum]|uniref:winged helix-turn-helix transcriptional regulator n=1 Tax=Flavobacterium psychrophilum TaxID=96345 RepID=UPI0004F5E7EF|nr:helix-turn-helix domain-containing protein [Flavobacterium psychrophilum]AIN73725.1 integrase [Flavobacterium psychrophilum FPG3]EKT2069746.1 helix-turn-helix transcriptional regulator [Flavobacterium psychrophilum]EKT2072006.1 helix-turn-helix transcriptional regulator [Flavobacterium psychrophilum]EKT3956731.1 helix-turn-helix transcriptional regulator [Flavobacterium psychrophilum]EKT3964024.1 helix-turn-helix transcriptional regulator [Flavobacterium psychrophilum]